MASTPTDHHDVVMITSTFAEKVEDIVELATGILMVHGIVANWDERQELAFDLAAQLGRAGFRAGHDHFCTDHESNS